MKDQLCNTYKKESCGLSSELLKRARDRFYEKYGSWIRPGEIRELERDKYGNPLHPKDRRPLATHYREFDRAIRVAVYCELMQDPLYQKAVELYRDVDWDEKEVEDVDGGSAYGWVAGSVKDEDGKVWEFTAAASFVWEGGWTISDLEDIEFTTPEGHSGCLPVRKE